MIESAARPAGGEADDLDVVIARRPVYAAALHEVLDAIWSQDVVDATTLELCRLRIGQMLGATPTPERVDAALAAALPRWPTDDRFDARTRAALGYAEQVLLDAQGVTDDDAHTVIEALGEDGFLVLTYACGVFETTQRAELVLGGAGSTS
ncbi:MAG TPA: hypothetical protein VFZ17_00285 [Acidimicrobiia bacterium]|nr:hypothetical protein [Acidimicrobiia bacterium]